MTPVPNSVSFFDRYSREYRPVGEIFPLGNAGGLSGARFWRFSATRGEFLLRRWPASETDAEWLRRRLGWIRLVADLPFVPAPVPALDGQVLQVDLGRFWHLEPWMSGLAETSRPPSEACVNAAMKGLALVHQRWEPLASAGLSPGLKLRMTELDALAHGALATLRRAVSESLDGPERRTAMHWIDEAPRLLEGVRRETRRAVEVAVTLQPTLRDVRSDHLLFTGDQLSGLVDFGALAIESPASDLARLLADWFEPDDPRRSRAVSAYEQVRPLDPRTRGLIPLFERSADLLLGGRWIRWRFVEHRDFDDTNTAIRGLETGLQRLRRRIAYEVGLSILNG